jgi:hypothetical protein
MNAGTKKAASLKSRGSQRTPYGRDVRQRPLLLARLKVAAAAAAAAVVSAAELARAARQLFDLKAQS